MSTIASKRRGGRGALLRSPRFAVCDTSTSTGTTTSTSAASVASFTLLWQRRRALGEGAVDQDDEKDAAGHQLVDVGGGDVPVDGHGHGDAQLTARGTGTGKGNDTTDELGMEQCIALLAPHLSVFREQCCASSTSTSTSTSASVSATDEVPPQLLRVARFFRWRWAPLKRALLRPAARVSSSSRGAESTKATSNATASAGSGSSMVEVGSAQLRLRLSRALHARGLLSLAEVDGLAASMEWEGRPPRPCKKRKVQEGQQHEEDSDDNDDDDDDNHANANDLTLTLASRLRLALSRLPSDASGGGTGSDQAKRGLRYAKSVLAEWAERFKDTSTSSARAACSTNSPVADCPSPETVADWSLTAFAGIVLTNGIDYQCRNKGDEGDVEPSLASILLDRSEALGAGAPDVGGGEKQANLGLAVDEKIRSFLSPQLIDELTEIHLLSLARLLSHAPPDIVEEYLVESIALCAQQCGGVGLKQLSRLIASYLSLVGPEGTDASRLEASLRKSIAEKQRPSSPADRLEEHRRETERALSFLGLIFQAAQFFHTYA